MVVDVKILKGKKSTMKNMLFMFLLFVHSRSAVLFFLFFDTPLKTKNVAAKIFHKKIIYSFERKKQVVIFFVQFQNVGHLL